MFLSSFEEGQRTGGLGAFFLKKEKTPFPPDSDEEIFVSKKPKSRKVLQDSDSEAEDRDDAPEKPTYDDSAEDTQENLHSGKSQSRSFPKALADSDESDMEETPSQESPETQEAPSLEPGHQTGHSVDFTTGRKLSKTLLREGAEGKAKSKHKCRLRFFKNYFNKGS